MLEYIDNLQAGDVLVDEFGSKGIVTCLNKDASMLYLMWDDGSCGDYSFEDLEKEGFKEYGANLSEGLTSLLKTLGEAI